MAALALRVSDGCAAPAACVYWATRNYSVISPSAEAARLLVAEEFGEIPQLIR